VKDEKGIDDTRAVLSDLHQTAADELSNYFRRPRIGRLPGHARLQFTFLQR